MVYNTYQSYEINFCKFANVEGHLEVGVPNRPGLARPDVLWVTGLGLLELASSEHKVRWIGFALSRLGLTQARPLSC